MNVRTNKLTNSGVIRKVRSDKRMPDTLVACRDCKLELPHAMLSKAHLCQTCAWHRMVRAFNLAWLHKTSAYQEWCATQPKSKTLEV